MKLAQKIANLLNATGWRATEKIAYMIDLGILAAVQNGIDRATYLSLCATRFDLNVPASGAVGGPQ